MPTRRHISIAVATLRNTFVTVLTAAGPVAAQPADNTTMAEQPADNTTMAEQLFNQGRELAKANDWAAACSKFEASLHYDPAIGTELNLATCYEKLGKLASAWGQYRDAADRSSKTDKRRDYALQQAAALEPRLPKLTIVAPANPPANFAVTRDRTRVDPALLGTSFYVDPGFHQIVASAPGYNAFTTSVTASEAKTETVAIPDLVAKPVEEPHGDDTEPIPLAKNSLKLAGLGTGVAGVAAIGIGVALGAKAKSTFNDAKALCGADLVCGNQADFDRGRSLVSDARRQATLSTVFGVAGGIAVAGGAVMWFVAPMSRHRETASVVPVVTEHRAGLAIVGRF
jgi:hypothetical protein